MNTKKKILIIDDEPNILEFLSYNFKKNDFEVLTASDGSTGLQKMREEKPDIILSDILMPEMDGIEMCREIKTDPQLSQIPIIFLTAVNDDYKVLYAMTSGADQFVSKPIRFEYLLEMVKTTLK
ncbi:MAG: DNA-binding response regulator MtrA [Bacteroidetes bacterium]|jgi:two-component system alkaline phosphatase synthesis response regulator PhoP|nr:DNA-binding response regulator MtrA [Bacteroidota bacterium]